MDIYSTNIGVGAGVGVGSRGQPPSQYNYENGLCPPPPIILSILRSPPPNIENLPTPVTKHQGNPGEKTRKYWIFFFFMGKFWESLDYIYIFFSFLYCLIMNLTMQRNPVINS